MKSIQNYIKQAYLYFALGLVGLGLLSVAIYSIQSYRVSSNHLSEIGNRFNLRINQSYTSLNNNLLVAENIFKTHPKITEKEEFGDIVSASIFFNPAQFSLWFYKKNEKSREFFITHKTPLFYQDYIKANNGKRFSIKYSHKNFVRKSFNVGDEEYSLLTNRLEGSQRTPGRLSFSGFYHDHFTNENLFSYSKSIVSDDGELLGVVGIDILIEGVKQLLAEQAGSNGVLVVQAKDNRTIFEIPTKNLQFTGKSTNEQIGSFNPLGNLSEMQRLERTHEIVHKNVLGNVIVFKVFQPISDWYIIVYQSAWTFYKAILPTFLMFLIFILSLLGLFLYYLNTNKQRILGPLNDIVVKIKKDTLIVGSQKSFSGHYPETPLLELNEIVNCINTLFEVINENFKKYRTELEKNIQSKNELEDLVKKRSELLIEREKFAAIGFMSAGLAHEIKNPLNLICNSAQIITQQLTKVRSSGMELNESAERAIAKLTESNQIVLDNGIRVDNIIKTLLLQVRSTKEGNAHLVDLSNLIKTNLEFVLSNYRPKLNNRINVNFNAPANKIILNANPVDLGRVFINIFDNSCQAVIPRINQNSDFNANFDITIVDEGQYVDIQVTDNGTGIGNEHLAQVFTPFFTTKPPGEGTGLGLNFVYEIIKQYHGQISIDSKVNEFTRIHIQIPYEGGL